MAQIPKCLLYIKKKAIAIAQKIELREVEENIILPFPPPVPFTENNA